MQGSNVRSVDVALLLARRACRSMPAARCKWSPGNAAGYRGVTAGETALHESTEVQEKK